ncbi:MAG TPA: TAT-variant-translocated molybdopterin oxidoreductase, partial [Polyangiaceae bacterium]
MSSLKDHAGASGVAHGHSHHSDHVHHDHDHAHHDHDHAHHDHDHAHDAARPERAHATGRPLFWRSFAELENRPEFREQLEREFAAPPMETAPKNSPERRRFLQLMGASLGLAGVGCRYPEDKILPLSRRPEDTVPGATKRYATAMELDGVAVGLHATSYDGRPIKIDGNPTHPESLGGTNPLLQASVLGVYDPDRSDKPFRRGDGRATASSWSEFAAFADKHFARLRTTRGFGLRVLAERSSSPTLLELKKRFQETYPAAKWVTYEPVSGHGARAGSKLAFGTQHRALLRTDQAKIIVSLGADLFAPSFPGHLAHARAVARRRQPDADMSRIYVAEHDYSLLGSFADHRLALRAEHIKAFAAALDAKVSERAKPLPELGPAQAAPKAQFLEEPRVAKFLEAVSKDLVANIGNGLIVAGPEQPAEVHAIAHRLNAVLGNVGRTVQYAVEPDPTDLSDVQALKQLADEMNRDRVETLVILGGNPAYTSPGDVDFGVALGRVKTSIHLSLYDDETSLRTTWHLNAAHYLESWGDARAWDGTISIVQPLIAPIYDGHSAIELVALMIGETAKAVELVRRTHSLADDRAFRRVVHDGLIQGSAFERVTPAFVPLQAYVFDDKKPNELSGLKRNNGELEVTFGPCRKVYDGRFANLAWLQELPEPMTKLTWDNAVLISPVTAKELGIEDGAPATVTLGGKSITLFAMWVPGQPEGSLRLALGYGRSAAGQVAGSQRAGVDTVGANAYALRTSDGFHAATGGSIARSSASFPRIGVTTDIHAIDPIGKEGVEERMPQLVREASLEEFKKDPRFVDKRVHHPPLLNLWVDPVSYEGHKWGMAIDINKCMGCSACVTACQAENNIPVVGRENVAKGREMLWLRVDRYYKGEPETAQVSFQPIPCQQCENAPCEQVCPVGATMHSHEGLNDMVYNRCIGTRYCSNNCPYKVRRFNYFNYNVDVIGVTPFTPTDDPKMKLKSMVFNPDVTVRSRGVMEKCTFCVQRLQNAKIKAKNAKRGL